jgi:hypothetical protein
MACLHNLLHASHFACLEPDLDAVWVEGRFREDVLHDTAGELSAPLILLLRNVYSQPRLDVFAVLTVHALASFALGRGGGAASVPTEAYRLVARVEMRSGVTVMSTRGSVFQRAT